MVTIDPLDLQAAIDWDERERIDDCALHKRGHKRGIHPNSLRSRLHLKATARSGDIAFSQEEAESVG
jgi:hypothetical protein